MHAVHYRAIYMERLCFMRYSSNIAQAIYASFTDRLHAGEDVNCVGEMFGHHVQSKCEIGRTYSKFGRTMSDDRQLFPALTSTEVKFINIFKLKVGDHSP